MQTVQTMIMDTQPVYTGIYPRGVLKWMGAVAAGWMGTVVSAAPPPDLMQWAAQIAQHPERQAAEAAWVAQQAQLRAARATWWPQWHAETQWGPNRLLLTVDDPVQRTQSMWRTQVDQKIWDPAEQQALVVQQWVQAQADRQRIQVDVQLHQKLCELYVQVLSAHHALGFAAADQQAIGRHRDRIQAAVRAGMGSPLELSEAQTRFDAAQIAWLQAHQALYQAHRAWSRFMERPLLRGWDIPGNRDPKKFDLPVLPWPQLRQALLAHNPAIRVAEAAWRIREAQHRQAQRAYWPVVSAFARYEAIKGAYADQFVNDPLVRARSRQVGLEWRWTVDTHGMLRAQTRQAYARQDQFHAAWEQAIRDNLQALQNAYLAFQNHPQQLAAAQQAVVSAEAEWQAVEAAFAAGLRTNADVLEAISQLTDAKRQYQDHYYRYIRHWITMHTLLGRTGPALLEPITQFLSQPVHLRLPPLPASTP